MNEKMTRDEIEEARTDLKIYFPNESAHRHLFNRICDQANIAARPEAPQTIAFQRYSMYEFPPGSGTSMDLDPDGEWVKWEDVKRLWQRVPQSNGR